MTEDECRQIEDMIDKIKPILAGTVPEVQGAALAELAAIWIWGHQIPGNAEATGRLRQDVMVVQDKAILKMVELFDAAGRPV